MRPLPVVRTTGTVTVPANARAITVTWVALTFVTLVADADPNFTPVVPVRFVPVSVIVVPPGAVDGLTDVRTGGAVSVSL